MSSRRAKYIITHYGGFQLHRWEHPEALVLAEIAANVAKLLFSIAFYEAISELADEARQRCIQPKDK